MRSLEGKVAVVTGAGSGIGRALAVELTRRGTRVGISDVDEVGLAATAELCRERGAVPHSQRLDVRDREAMSVYADTIVAHFGGVNLVINNAGITIFGTVRETPFADLDKVMDVDFWGVVNGTKAFLPHLIASGDGHLVNISSIFGLFGVPNQSSYNAAKFAVRGFTEALRQEMLISKQPVGVTCVHPGGIKTNIVNNATASNGAALDGIQQVFDRYLTHTTPESAAGAILRGVTGNHGRILIGLDAHAIDLVVRILGPNYQRLFSRAAQFLLRPLTDATP
ncbi:SDR family NAD(P)-dependent oxidoreductase [Nocardia sp. NBC_01327]|uniref:SDR family NAD(P)-dependent oxidoreductase n=1 Tax=Nocardia sp. NBC_01327 TaxID=2903593 RepID=UPI002E12A131|nr:SDR family NAD(P)-dependent oxidoreductase [Nocardia sp. NBC_01327]